jgi:hypothetical protein
VPHIRVAHAHALHTATFADLHALTLSARHSADFAFRPPLRLISNAIYEAPLDRSYNALLRCNELAEARAGTDSKKRAVDFDLSEFDWPTTSFDTINFARSYGPLLGKHKPWTISLQRAWNFLRASWSHPSSLYASSFSDAQMHVGSGSSSTFAPPVSRVFFQHRTHRTDGEPKRAALALPHKTAEP